MRIGIDIGGTNTDAVLVDGQDRIIASYKTGTTPDIVTGFQKALEGLPQENIRSIIIGTTHATNAILERRGLAKVGVIRLAGHFPDTLPSCMHWPKPLKEAIGAPALTVNGGYNCDGSEITPLDEKEIETGIARLADLGVEALAVVGTFSPLNPWQENEVRQIAAGRLPVTLSHEIAGMGIVERENGAILNAALGKILEQGFNDLKKKAAELGYSCPLFLTQNNGSLFDLETALKFPIRTLSAGPTNSFVGGAKLAGLSNAIVVDIGGTSTDIGIVRHGYPRRCLKQSAIGGVCLSDSLPDVQAIALGGGSHIHLRQTPGIGPQSLSRRLLQEGVCFGGAQLTLTDIALKMGSIHIPGAMPELVDLPLSACSRIIQEGSSAVSQLIEKISLGEKELPVVLIGEGLRCCPSKGRSSRSTPPWRTPMAQPWLRCRAHSTQWLISLTGKKRSPSCKRKPKRTPVKRGQTPNAFPLSNKRSYPITIFRETGRALS